MQAVVKLEQNQGVATLTLNRPQVLNTLNFLTQAVQIIQQYSIQ